MTGKYSDELPHGDASAREPAATHSLSLIFPGQSALDEANLPVNLAPVLLLSSNAGRGLLQSATGYTDAGIYRGH